MSTERTRADRINAQHFAYDLFFWLYQGRPDLVEEERRNRAAYAKKLNPVVAEIDAKLGGGLNHGR